VEHSGAVSILAQKSEGVLIVGSEKRQIWAYDRHQATCEMDISQPEWIDTPAGAETCGAGLVRRGQSWNAW
jgi:hypothetical protein